MKKLKAVQHVYIVNEHSETNLRMISHMTKKLLKFQTFINSLKIE